MSPSKSHSWWLLSLLNSGRSSPLLVQQITSQGNRVLTFPKCIWNWALVASGGSSEFQKGDLRLLDVTRVQLQSLSGGGWTRGQGLTQRKATWGDMTLVTPFNYSSGFPRLLILCTGLLPINNLHWPCSCTDHIEMSFIPWGWAWHESTLLAFQKVYSALVFPVDNVKWEPAVPEPGPLCTLHALSGTKCDAVTESMHLFYRTVITKKYSSGWNGINTGKKPSNKSFVTVNKSGEGSYHKMYSKQITL